MEDEYNIPMSVGMEREVGSMCNLSYGIAAEAVLNTLISLVEDNLLDISEAAKRAEMSELEFSKQMKKNKKN